MPGKQDKTTYSVLFFTIERVIQKKYQTKVFSFTTTYSTMDGFFLNAMLLSCFAKKIINYERESVFYDYSLASS